MKLIDKDILVAEIEKELNATKKYSTEYVNGKRYALKKIISFLDTIAVKEVDFEREHEHPEPYFYCKYGGTIPLCSDCKRNHNNSSFKTEEITTWYAPSNGTKHCMDYIQQEQSKMDLEKEIDSTYHNYVAFGRQEIATVAKHFFELGLKTTQKGE